MSICCQLCSTIYSLGSCSVVVKSFIRVLLPLQVPGEKLGRHLTAWGGEKKSGWSASEPQERGEICFV